MAIFPETENDLVDAILNRALSYDFAGGGSILILLNGERTDREAKTGVIKIGFYLYIHAQVRGLTGANKMVM
jgi:hypothetical protein